jgi:hypothetical protein
LTVYPFLVVAFWAFLFGLVGEAMSIIFGGVIVVGGALFIWWAGTNIIMWICNPKEMRLWKKGGGDPWFDTLPESFNPDPPEVRFLELYRERLRMEEEEGIHFD